MHRGKVHDDGGESSFNSVMTVEIFNKHDDSHDRLDLPRIRTIVPFIKKDSTKNLCVGDTVDFKIEKVDAITKYGSKVPAIVAVEVEKVNHAWFHKAYLLKSIYSLIVGLVVILVVHYIFNSGELLKGFSWKTLAFNALGALWQCLLIGLIIVYWSGTRTIKGGSITGLKLGLFIGLFILFYAVKNDCFSESSDMFLSALEYFLSYAFAGLAIGYVLESKKGEFKGFNSSTGPVLGTKKPNKQISGDENNDH